MKKITLERALIEQALAALVRSEVMHGQPNFDIQKKLREALEQNISSEKNPVFVLLAVEEAVKNGDCPFQIEQAFDEYEIQRRAAVHIESLKS